ILSILKILTKIWMGFDELNPDLWKWLHRVFKRSKKYPKFRFKKEKNGRRMTLLLREGQGTIG
ncbi:MAG: hypothetical protein ACRCYZ_06115, partial [Alphaproteobacteria bacterium]